MIPNVFSITLCLLNSDVILVAGIRFYRLLQIRMDTFHLFQNFYGVSRRKIKQIIINSKTNFAVSIDSTIALPAIITNIQ